MAVTVSPSENASVWGPAVVAVAILLANLLAWALNPRSWAHRHLLSRAGVPKMLFVSNRCDSRLAQVPQSPPADSTAEQALTASLAHTWWCHCRREGVSQVTRPQSYWCFDLLDPHHLVSSSSSSTVAVQSTQAPCGKAQRHSSSTRLLTACCSASLGRR